MTAFIFIFLCSCRDDVPWTYVPWTWRWYVGFSAYILLLLGIVFWACPVYVTYERVNRWPDCASSWWPMDACMDESARYFKLKHGIKS